MISMVPMVRVLLTGIQARHRDSWKWTLGGDVCFPGAIRPRFSSVPGPSFESAAKPDEARWNDR